MRLFLPHGIYLHTSNPAYLSTTLARSVETKAHECANLMSRATIQGSKHKIFADQARNFIEASKRVKSLVLMALDNTHRMKLNRSGKHSVRLSSQLKPINNWDTHISAYFFEILQVIRKSSSKTPFSQSVESYHACRVSWDQCPAAAACCRNKDRCYNHLKEVVEWSIDDPETSQEPCWSNWKINRWTSFQIDAQHSSYWLGNSLNMPKPSKLICKRVLKL